MRYPILILATLLALGCGSKQPAAEKPDPIVKYGLITDKEEVDLETVESDSRVNTSIFASISTGGRFSIGLGFLLGPFKSSKSEESPLRYEVAFVDGGEMTIYHLSTLFEVDDCVEITIYPDEEENPPTMVRSKDGCGS